MNPSSSPESSIGCVLNSWRAHESELRGYLMHRLADSYLADDLVQEVFLKAIRYGKGFCVLDKPRAWLFQVARNTFVDTFRLSKDTVPLAEDLVREEYGAAPVDALIDGKVVHAGGVPSHDKITQWLTT